MTDEMRRSGNLLVKIDLHIYQAEKSIIPRLRKYLIVKSYKMKPGVSLSFCLVLVFACSPGKLKDENNFWIFVTDTAMSHLSFNELDFSLQKCVEFNLPRIDRGVDSFELRIWLSSMSTPSQFLILRFANSKWDFQKYYYLNGEYGVDSLHAFRQDIPNGIDSLVEYLQHMEIITLPSQVPIPGFVDNISDGQTCTIEISTRKFYKAMEYQDPSWKIGQ
jgi:hypothetical protein